MKEQDEDNQLTTLPTEEEADKTRPLAGFLICVAGIVCLMFWGLIFLLNPSASNQINESSMISINGNGIFLILSVTAIIAGATLLLKNKKI